MPQTEMVQFDDTKYTTEFSFRVARDAQPRKSIQSDYFKRELAETTKLESLVYS